MNDHMKKEEIMKLIKEVRTTTAKPNLNKTIESIEQSIESIEGMTAELCTNTVTLSDGLKNLSEVIEYNRRHLKGINSKLSEQNILLLIIIGFFFYFLFIK